MKVDNLVQEGVPNKRNKLKIMISETQLEKLINKTVESPNIIKKNNNEKK
jgi:hypothetical protein